MNKEYKTITEINEALKNRLQPISEALTVMSDLKSKIVENRNTYEEIKVYAEFTMASLECLALLDEGNALSDKAPRIALHHLENNEYDKFKEDKKQLKEFQETLEKHKKLFDAYSELIDDVA